jgi:quinol monooxygenase YgiN
MSKVVVVVSLKASEGRVDELIDAFRGTIEQTHKEDGNQKYALHRDQADPDRVILIEHWRSQDDLDAHMKQPYMGELMTKAGAPGLLAEPPHMWFTNPEPIGDDAKGQL